MVFSKILFKNNILKFIRSKPNSFFQCCNLKAIRLITRVRLELSHLREHNFRYNFQNYFNPLCSCGSSIDSTSHFLLHCPVFHDKRHSLLSTLNNIDSKILESTYSYLTQTLLFGCTSFHSETKTLVLNATIDYILYTEISEEPLLYKKMFFICNYLILSELAVVYFIYLFFTKIIILIYYVHLFFRGEGRGRVGVGRRVIPGTLSFQCLVVVIFYFIVLYYISILVNRIRICVKRTRI